jgi:16S rRNA (cytosine1402-N4)-methyltransferase
MNNASPASSNQYHPSAMVSEAVSGLNVMPGNSYIDCTLGSGGHTQAILKSVHPGGRVLGIDLDPQAVEVADQRLSEYQSSYTLVRDNFSNLATIAPIHGFKQVQGILMDVGISLVQLEHGMRGFSFMRDEPLDMRYDPEQELTAAEVVNGYPLEKLAWVIFTYGEELRSWNIARAITHHRPIRSSLELALVVEKASGTRRRRIHPATRTFQSIRIEVNGELQNLALALEQAVPLLSFGGRLVVISWHSLEARLVKRMMRRESTDCLCPPKTPGCICGHKASLKVINRRVIRPSAEELRANPRSRSAQMRISERL